MSKRVLTSKYKLWEVHKCRESPRSSDGQSYSHRADLRNIENNGFHQTSHTAQTKLEITQSLLEMLEYRTQHKTKYISFSTRRYRTKPSYWTYQSIANAKATSMNIISELVGKWANPSGTAILGQLAIEPEQAPEIPSPCPSPLVTPSPT